MALTRDEVILAARRARDYPVEQGYVWFAGTQTGDPRKAAAALARHPQLLERG